MFDFFNKPSSSWLPIGLFVLIAGHHFYQVHSSRLSPWLGGGFGMFSTTDYGPSRFIRVEGLIGNTVEVIEIPERYSRLGKQVRGLPSDNNLLELAKTLEAYLMPRQPRFQALTITVWSTRYHPATLQPNFSPLNRIVYKTVTNANPVR